jgi:hypothetical protein
MIFLGLGMRMSFGGIIDSCNLFLFFYGTLFLSEGGKKVFNGAIVCNLFLFYSAPREQNPPNM